MKSISPKLTFGFLGLVGLATLLLGFISLSQTIRNPAKQSMLAREQALEQNLLSADNQEILRNKDTDQDGLSDYDEINLYRTSPYLPDSDSDGFRDKQEIDSGNDPNCPTGNDCRTSQIAVPEEQGQTLDNLGVEQFEGLLDQQETGNRKQETGEEVIDLTNLTTDEIRQLLLESGEISQEQLDQIDNETLMEVYREVIGSGGVPTNQE